MRAVSLSLLLVLQRTNKIRRKYPTWKYVPGTITGKRPNGGRDSFPPRTENPWKYQPRRREDPDFSMMYALIAMGFVGSTCGGNIPLVPSWMGALIGGGVFALSCLQPNPRGDLSRTLGMRVVALLTELWEIQAQLKLIPKAAVVSGQIIDRAMILDRKHRVKDRFLSLVTTSYNKVMDMTNTSGDGQDERSRRGREENRRRDGDDRDDNRGRGGRDERRPGGPERRRRGGDDDDYDRTRRPAGGRRDDDDDSRRGRRRDDDRNRDIRDQDERRLPFDDDNDDNRRHRYDADDANNRRRRPEGDNRSRDIDDEPKKGGRFGRMFGKK